MCIRDSIRPALFRKIIVSRHRVLKDMVSEPERLMFQIIQFGLYDILIDLLTGLLIHCLLYTSLIGMNLRKVNSLIFLQRVYHGNALKWL